MLWFSLPVLMRKMTFILFVIQILLTPVIYPIVSSASTTKPVKSCASKAMTATSSKCQQGDADHRQKTAWKPKASDTFNLQLSGPFTTNVTATIYDIDLFDTSTAQIAQLKQQGRKVVCYFSAGSSENWRPDFIHFLKADMGKPLEGWPGENWLDTRSNNVRKMMRTRIALAATKGCNGIDADNVDGYNNATGFNLTSSTQLDYNRFLSSQAHARGLAIGLKNDVAQLRELAPNFEFAVNEQCHEFNECDLYKAFTSLNKPVLNVEYQSRYVENTDSAFDALCINTRSEHLHTLVLPLSLDGSFRRSCD